MTSDWLTVENPSGMRSRTGCGGDRGDPLRCLPVLGQRNKTWPTRLNHCSYLAMIFICNL
jgi:hypothetical protein